MAFLGDSCAFIQPVGWPLCRSSSLSGAHSFCIIRYHVGQLCMLARRASDDCYPAWEVWLHGTFIVNPKTIEPCKHRGRAPRPSELQETSTLEPITAEGTRNQTLHLNRCRGHARGHAGRHGQRSSEGRQPAAGAGPAARGAGRLPRVDLLRKFRRGAEPLPYGLAANLRP